MCSVVEQYRRRVGGGQKIMGHEFYLVSSKKKPHCVFSCMSTWTTCLLRSTKFHSLSLVSQFAQTLTTSVNAPSKRLLVKNASKRRNFLSLLKCQKIHLLRVFPKIWTFFRFTNPHKLCISGCMWGFEKMHCTYMVIKHHALCQENKSFMEFYKY